MRKEFSKLVRFLRQCSTSQLTFQWLQKRTKGLFALNIKVFFHFCSATEGWFWVCLANKSMGKGSGEAYYVYLNMMVISGKCEFKALCFKNTLLISVSLILLMVSAGIWNLGSFNPNASHWMLVCHNTSHTSVTSAEKNTLGKELWGWNNC